MIASFGFLIDREIMQIKGCIAIVNDKGQEKGLPLLRRRPTVNFEGERWLVSRFLVNEKEGCPRNPDLNSEKPFVLHTCDHKWCINPEHLYLGSASDNSNDLFSRNFEAWQNTKKPKSEEHKAALRGIVRSEETRKKISEIAKRRAPASLETRKKISEKAKGRLHSEDTKMKIRLAQFGVPKNPDSVANMKETKRLGKR